jgi:hypothetical protein
VILDSSKDLSDWIVRPFDSTSDTIVNDDSDVGTCALGKDFTLITPLSSVKVIAVYNIETKRIENIDASFVI